MRSYPGRGYPGHSGSAAVTVKLSKAILTSWWLNSVSADADCAPSPKTAVPCDLPDASLAQLRLCQKWLVAMPSTRAIRSEPRVWGNGTHPKLVAAQPLWGSPGVLFCLPLKLAV